MKRSQAAAELSTLHFDESGYAHKMALVERQLAHAQSHYDKAELEFESDLREFEKLAFEECEAQLK